MRIRSAICIVIAAGLAAAGYFLYSLSAQTSAMRRQIDALQDAVTAAREEGQKQAEEIVALRKKNDETEAALAVVAGQTTQVPPGIRLCPTLYAVQEHELNIYFDNIISDRDTRYDYNIICDIGELHENYYRVVPNTGGVYSLSVQVIDRGTVVAETAAELLVAEPLPEARLIRCMVVGDSIVGNERLVPLLAENLAAAGIPAEFLGTLGETPCRYEGRGGWTTQKYLRCSDSPFVYDGTFDFSRYMEENGFRDVDYLFIVLGINDIFPVEDTGALEETIRETLAGYHELIGGIQAFDDRIRIGLCVTIPPAYTQDEFGALYGTEYPRWRYKRNNFAWTSAMIDEFRNVDGVDLIPINVNLDTRNNMGTQEIPINAHNSDTRTVTAPRGHVHPDESGYWQIADEMYYYIQCMEARIIGEDRQG